MLRSVRRLPGSGWLATGLLVGALALTAPAQARDERQGAPGKFDFYVLALSWSPSFCEAQGERAPRQQCGERPYSFVVHGLWPQYERGFPEYCQVPAPRLDRNTVSLMLDIMPSPRLVFHQWDKHGTCSGLSPRAYFENVRKAHAVVKIPPEYLNLQRPLTVSPDEVEEAFVKANPGLTREAIAVTCDNRLREVRICMTREFGFHPCEEINRRACRRDKVIMPPVRGGARSAGTADPQPDAAAKVTEAARP
jgi:ribonuclease T2